VVDEIQKAPELLNYIQMGIDQLGQVFLMSGSSARKLRRGSVNLLGGRALDLRLHPLTASEIGPAFDLEQTLEYGTLPHIHTLVQQRQFATASGHLKSYHTTYLREEIQAEALTRKLGPFQRFLAIAAQCNGQVIEFANIARDSAVPASTVKEYYQILEDTLLGFYLWPFDHSERRKARPKFYFFDCGVVRAVLNRQQTPPTQTERGILFETWFVNEIKRRGDYAGKPHEYAFWRDRTGEIDLVISRHGKPVLAIECKAGATDLPAATIERFRARFPATRLIIASASDPRPRRVHGVEVMPWQQALEIYCQLG